MSIVAEEIEVYLVTPYYYPVLSGATERFRRYAPNLLKRGIRLRVLTLQTENSTDHEVFEGIEINRFPLSQSSKDPYTILLRQVVKRLNCDLKPPHVLQVISHTLQGVPYIWRVRSMGIPCLNTITLHPLEAKTPVGQAKQFLRQWLRYLPFDCSVTSSAVISQVVEKQGYQKKRIKIIPNGVDIQRFRPIISIEEQAKIRTKLGLPVDDEIILFIGFISHRKGIDILINAWSEIINHRPKARLILVGPQSNYPRGFQPRGSDERAFIEAIDILVQKSLHSDRITFVGEVENVEDYFRASDVFVLPSRFEGMGNVVAEAMASGLPCVITPFKGLPDEFGKSEREYVLTSYEPGKLAESIITLFEDQGKRIQLGKAARNLVVKNLDVEKSVDAYAQLYRDLARKSRSNGK